MRHVPAGIGTALALLLTAAVLLGAIPAAAADPSSDFAYTLSGGSATITGYVGGDTAVDIPATITDNGTTYAVTTIGANAFRGNLLASPLTSVTIPDTVTTIGDNAFRGDLLTSVVIPDSVTTIDTYVFYNNALTSVTLGDSVSTIGNNSFRGNALTWVTIPESVTSIGNNSFASNLLASVTIPASVTSIGNGAFATNTLTSVIFVGAAPTTFTPAGTTGSLDTGIGLIVYSYPGAPGFTSPWQGYTARVISASESELSLTPSEPVTAGTTPYTLSVTVRDDTHTPVAGVPVAFAIPGGITASASACTTTEEGTCTTTLASTTAATYLVTATVGADPAILTEGITFASAPPTMAVSVDQNSVTLPALKPSGSGTTEITIPAGTLTVQSTTAYAVTLTDLGGLTATGSGLTHLSGVLEASSTLTAGTPESVALADPTPLTATPGAAGPGVTIAGSTTATANDTYDLSLTQPVSWTDPPATYTDTLTYTISAPTV
jgi:hypothetical protein